MPPSPASCWKPPPSSTPPNDKAASPQNLLSLRGRTRAHVPASIACRPAAVRCLLADRDSLTVCLRFPREHRGRIRHSSFTEPTSGETRRRVKVTGRLPGEHSCLSLARAVPGRSAAGWRGLTMTSAALRVPAGPRLSRTGLPAPSRDDSVTPGTRPGPKAAAGA
jgi:hypothetical protein